MFTEGLCKREWLTSCPPNFTHEKQNTAQSDEQTQIFLKSRSEKLLRELSSFRFSQSDSLSDSLSNSDSKPSSDWPSWSLGPDSKAISRPSLLTQTLSAGRYAIVEPTLTDFRGDYLSAPWEKPPWRRTLWGGGDECDSDLVWVHPDWEINTRSLRFTDLKRSFSL